jgi:hypothetical protein
MEDFVDLLNVQSLLWFPLPAPQHDIIYFFGADSGPLQDTTLGNTFDDLQEWGKKQGSYIKNSALALRLLPRKTQQLH